MALDVVYAQLISWQFVWSFVFLSITSTVQYDPLPIPAAPTIRVLLTPKRVPQGATPTFICEVAGAPLPVISEWRKDNVLVSLLNRRIQLMNEKTILQIRRLSPHDAGLYECFAEAGGLKLSASAQLRVIVPPVIHNVTNATAVVGENVTLTCLTKHHLFLRWKFNGSFIHSLPRYELIGLGQQMVINNVRETDHGWYLCQAFNEGFNSIERVHLFVLIPPRIVSGPKNTFVPALWTITFPCLSVGRPQPTSLWMHNREVVALDRRPNVAIYSDRIEIANATVQDDGKYCCEVVNDAGVATSDCATLTVLGTLAVFVSTVVNIAWGSSVTLNCSIASSNVSKVQWTVDGAVLDSKLHTRFNQLGSRQLAVDKVLYTDNLVDIVCSVKINDSAIAVKTFQLTVTEASAAPTDVSVSALTPGVMKVSWKWSSVYKLKHRVVLYHHGSIVNDEVVVSEASSAVIGYDNANTIYTIVVETLTAEGAYLPSKPVEFMPLDLPTVSLSLNGFKGDDITSDEMLATRETSATMTTTRSGQNTPVSHGNDKALSNYVIPVASVTGIITAAFVFILFLWIVKKRKTNYEVQSDSASSKDMEMNTNNKK